MSNSYSTPSDTREIQTAAHGDEVSLADECLDGVSDYVDKEKMDAKLLSRKHLSDATRLVRSLGRVCRAARRSICRAYPDSRWAPIPNQETNTLQGCRPTRSPGNYYTLRINGKRDLCVLAVSDWERQAYALRNPGMSVVPKCIRHLDIDLDTLFDDRGRREEDSWWGFLDSCACPSDGLPDGHSFPLAPRNRITPGAHMAFLPRRVSMGAFLAILKTLDGIETVVLVSVCDPLLALAEPALIDGEPYSRRVRKVHSWEEADDLAEGDTTQQCIRPYDGRDGYAFVPLWPVEEEEELVPPVLNWIWERWRESFPYMDHPSPGHQVPNCQAGEGAPGERPSRSFPKT